METKEFLTNAQKKELLKERLTSAAYARERQVIYEKMPWLDTKNKGGSQADRNYWRKVRRANEKGSVSPNTGQVIYSSNEQSYMDDLNSKYEKYLGPDKWRSLIQKYNPEDYDAMFPNG